MGSDTPTASATAATTVVVVTHNSAPYIPGLRVVRRALDDFDWPGGARLVVWDNGSTDGSGQLCAGIAHQVFYSDSNLGFGQAVNAALRGQVGTWIVLMNPDTRTTPQTWLGLRATIAERAPSREILVPSLRSPDGTEQPNVIVRPTALTDISWALAGETGTRLARAFQRKWGPSNQFASGAFLVIPTALFREVDGFDPAFFLYGEEVDLALRLAARAPVNFVQMPDVVVEHDGSQGWRGKSPDALARMLYSKILLAQRYDGGIWGKLVGPALQAGVVLRAAFAGSPQRAVFVAAARRLHELRRPAGHPR